MEDVIDMFKALFPEFDILILLDHSNGHDKLLSDGLNPAAVNKGYGGSQPHMKASTIKNETYLGPYKYEDTLSVGDVQSIVYSENDVGPFDMTPEDREAKRNDIDTGRINKHVKLKKHELKELLKAQGVANPKGRRTKLAQQCEMLGLPTEKCEKIIKEGWVGTPKGALQILYERGFIDKENLKKYTMDGKKDLDGTIITNTSLKQMLECLPDFMEQETVLQFYARQLGVMIDRTPKCHPEVAGEGIEYGWGTSKEWYRRQPLSQKKGKDSFIVLVKRSLSREVLGITTMRKCAAKARRYILAYHQLAAFDDNGNEKEPMNMKLIENVTNQYYKRHRDVHNHESGFINELVDGMSKAGKTEK